MAASISVHQARPSYLARWIIKKTNGQQLINLHKYVSTPTALRSSESETSACSPSLVSILSIPHYVFFPKASPMLGFSFSRKCRGRAADGWGRGRLGREDGGERDGRCIVHGMGVDACAADMLVTRTWLHRKHHCRLLRVSAQVEGSMGGGSAAPCFAEARYKVSGAVLRGLYDGLGCPKCAQCMRQTVKSWPKRQDCCVEHMVAPQASLQAAPGQCTSRTKHGWG